MFDPGKMYLSKAEEDMFLEHFKARDSAAVTRVFFEFLQNRGLVENDLDGKTGWFDDLPDSGHCRLSDAGRRYQSWLLQSRHNKKIANIKDCVAISLSVIAVVISILSLIL